MGAAKPLRRRVAAAVASSCLLAACAGAPAGGPASRPATPVTSAAPPTSTVPAASPTTASPPRLAPPAAATGAPPPAVRTVTLGFSVQGRPITATELGDPAAARKLVVVGCIHGNEAAGISIARHLETLAPPPATDVWVIEDLNPDGVAAGTRQNAHGVDLNRNFPYLWAVLGPPGSQQYAGAAALSEPESTIAYQLLSRLHPAITIWFHQPLGLVDLSGGDPSVEQRYAGLVGMPSRQLTRYPGSAPGWEDHQFPGTTAFVVELPPGGLSAAAANRYATASLALLR